MSTKDASLPIGADPPAFGCVIYLSRRDSGGVHARVANLEGLAIDAADERSALGKLVPMFRERLAAFVEKGEEIPWIKPPSQKLDGETKRFLPVHL